MYTFCGRWLSVAIGGWSKRDSRFGMGENEQGDTEGVWEKTELRELGKNGLWGGVVLVK